MKDLYLPDSDIKKYRGERPSKKEGLLQMAEGLAYLHSKNLAHRDIKPANVLLSSTDPAIFKWADFGLVKEFNEEGSHSFGSGVHCTWDWAAPEVLELLNEEESDQGIKKGSVKSDVFSAGMLFFYWLTDGVHPFGNGVLSIQSNLVFNNCINKESKYRLALILDHQLNQYQ